VVDRHIVLTSLRPRRSGKAFVSFLEKKMRRSAAHTQLAVSLRAGAMRWDARRQPGQLPDDDARGIVGPSEEAPVGLS